MTRRARLPLWARFIAALIILPVALVGMTLWAPILTFYSVARYVRRGEM